VISYLIKLITLSPDGEARNNVTLGSPASVTADGFLADINVQSVDDDDGPGAAGKTQDVKEFFAPCIYKGSSQ
jgi:hypothetical protein